MHIFSTNNHIPTDAEFAEKLLSLEDEANSLLSLQEKATAEELEALVKRLNVETALLSVEDGRLVMNDLKRKSFLFKQELRKCYRSGVTLKAAYEQSERLQAQDEILWKEFDIKLSHIVKVGYQDLLKDYIETQDETLLLEYPEFKQITQYLTTKEMASCKWKKETMLKHVEDKKKLETAFRNIYVKDKYFTNAELKEILRQEFTKLGITLTPKATLIRECKLYDVTQKKSGYLFGSYKFDFSLKL